MYVCAVRSGVLYSCGSFTVTGIILDVCMHVHVCVCTIM